MTQTSFLLACVYYPVVERHTPERVKLMATAVSSWCPSRWLRHILLSFQPEINQSELLGWPL